MNGRHPNLPNAVPKAAREKTEKEPLSGRSRRHEIGTASGSAFTIHRGTGRRLRPVSQAAYVE